MLRFTLLLSSAALLLVGCGSKTEAEKQEEERVEIREKKRQLAEGFYKDLATKFPEHEKAKEADAKAKALAAKAPPKS